MAINTEIGIRFSADLTDLTAGLQEVARNIKHNSNVFKEQTAGMDDWKNSSDGLNAKLQQLKGNTSLYAQEIEALERELDRLKSAEGENSAMINKRTEQLLKSKAALKGTEKQIESYSQKLEEVEAAENGATEGNEKYSKSLNELRDNTKKTNTLLSSSISILNNLVARGISAAIGALNEALSAAKEFRKELGYLQAAANSSGASFDNAKENLNEVASITEDTGAAVEGLNNLMTAGFDGSKLDEITDLLTGAAIKWKDTLKFEGLSDGLQETLATGEAVGPFAELLERSGISLDTFNKGLAGATTSAEKQNYILKVLSEEGLAKVKEDYVQTNKGLVEGNEAMFNFQTTMATLSEKLDPVFTAIRNGFTQILNKIIELVGDTNLDSLIEKINTGFGFFVDTIVPMIVNVITFAIDNLPVIIGILGAVVAKLLLLNVANMIKNVAASFTKWTATIRGTDAATKNLTKSQRILNAVTKANPIGFIISLISSLIGMLIYWAQTNEKVGKWFKDVWNGIKLFFTDFPKWFEEIGKNMMEGLWNGLKSIWNKIAKWFEDAWNSVVDGFKNFFGIHSPSKLMDKLGVNIGEGLGLGIKHSIPKVKKELNAFNNFVNDNLSGVKSGLSAVDLNGSNKYRTSQLASNNQVVNAGLTINYNGQLNRKQVRRLEDEYYRTIKLRLKSEGAI